MNRAIDSVAMHRFRRCRFGGSGVTHITIDTQVIFFDVFHADVIDLTSIPRFQPIGNESNLALATRGFCDVKVEEGGVCRFVS